ncbi:MAG: hypothetical protein M1503_02580 [Thaumarchaeota archaeon]|nr:hypothetical protein [Nitrososphaerota archaeon]
MSKEQGTHHPLPGQSPGRTSISIIIKWVFHARKVLYNRSQSEGEDAFPMSMLQPVQSPNTIYPN